MSVTSSKYEFVSEFGRSYHSYKEGSEYRCSLQVTYLAYLTMIA